MEKSYKKLMVKINYW